MMVKCISCTDSRTRFQLIRLPFDSHGVNLCWLHRMSIPKKSLNDGSTHPFSSPSSDQTHDDKVFCMRDSLIQFPTLLSITEAQKEGVRRWVPGFIFSQGCKSPNFWAQNGRYQFPSLLLFNMLSNNNKVGNPTTKLETTTIKSGTELLFTYNKVVNSGL